MPRILVTRRRNAFVIGAILAALALIVWVSHNQIRRHVVTVQPSITIERTNLKLVPVYGLFEADLNVTANFENPFDQEEVNVTAIFNTPNGAIIRIPAFYYQEFNRSLVGDEEKLTPIGKPYWKVRFTPREIGEYKFHAMLEDEGQIIETDRITFNCSSSDNRGFVRISNRDQRFFQFDDDSSFFFIGHDVCWFGSKGTYDYDTWFSSMNLNGEKITRIWMAPWAFGIEWKRLGYYDMAEAWRLDYVLEEAREKDIYVLLCLMNHGQLQSGGLTGQFNDNPYNAARGGPLARPEDFWRDETAKELFKRRLRYIVSRWGYSTQVLAWELWNEVELTDNYNFEQVADWHNLMAQYLLQIDPYRHLVTTSSDPHFGNLDSMDLLTVHRYGPAGFLDIGGAIHSMISELLQSYEKPVLVSEFGADWRWFDDPYTTKDKEGVQIHNGIWSSVHSGSASSAMLWWWDNYIHPFDLYYHFKALSKYLEGIQPDRSGFESLKVKLVPPEEISVRDLCDITVYPSLGWARPEANLFEVDLFGHITNLSQLSGFVHGGYHPELRNNPTFIVEFPYSGEAVIHVNSVANSGAVLRVYIDGLQVNSTSLPDKDGKNADSVNEYNMDVRVLVPLGKHEIKIDNSGNDWFTYDYIKFTNAVLKVSKARVIGLGNETFAMAWIQNKDHTWWNVVNKVPVEPLRQISMELEGFQSGEYVVEWWNTYSGEIANQETVRVTDGKIPLSVGNLENDIAVKLYIRK